MTQTQSRQFRLMDDGRIYFQADPTNPLPGRAVAMIRKGEALLKPDAAMLPGETPEGIDETAAAGVFRLWLREHIAAVLEPLKALEDEEGISGPAQDIALRLYEGLGVLPREALGDLIAGLDPEGRAALRARKVRMGPLLVYLPTLNKPAAVKLRALLWWLWHDRELPAPAPKDGIVSYIPQPGTAPIEFYQAIGYPLYGPRAIRVDMLDRLVGSVYDTAEKGVFQAKHGMAEWLGCPIPDLYAVLEAMGHTKIHDPADEVKPEAPKAQAVTAEEAKPEAEALPAPAGASAEPAAEPVPEPEQEPQAAEPEPAPQSAPQPEEAQEGEKAEEKKETRARPELATFRLRRGKAAEARRQEGDREPGRDGGGKGRGRRERGKESGDREKVIRPILLKPGEKTGRPRRKDGDREDRKGRRDREKDDRPDRVIEVVASKARPEDSPFAILAQLKAGRDDG